MTQPVIRPANNLPVDFKEERITTLRLMEQQFVRGFLFGLTAHKMRNQLRADNETSMEIVKNQIAAETQMERDNLTTLAKVAFKVDVK